MISETISQDIDLITFLFIKNLIHRTDRNNKVPVSFVEVYEESCNLEKEIDHNIKSNLEIRQHVRDNLLKNEFIFINPNDAETIFVAQKSITKYDFLSKEK